MSVAINMTIPPVARNGKIAAANADAFDLRPSKPGAAFAALKIRVKRPPILFSGGSDILNDISLCPLRHSALWE